MIGPSRAYVFVLLLFCFALVLANPARPAACAKGAYVIGIRGHGHDPPQPYGNLTSAVDGIKQRIPGSVNDTINYPREFVPPSPNAIGGQHLLTKIKNHAARCPDTPIIIVGYSQGGIIIMNTICGGSSNTGTDNPPISTTYLNNIIAIGLYGEESRAYGQSYNRGTCLTYGTYARENPEGCFPYANRIHSWCDAPDPLCCYGGTNRGAHSLYPRKYDDDLFKFVLNRYQIYLNSK